MKAVVSIAVLLGLALASSGQDAIRRARDLESKGDGMGARMALLRAVRSSPNDPNLLQAYAEFLDRYGDPETRDNYEKLLGLLETSPDNARRAAVARRLVVLDLLDTGRDSAARHLKDYTAAGGRKWSLPSPKPQQGGPKYHPIEIPGPLRSFARMAAISPEIPKTDLLSALARNVVTNGYQAGTSGDSLEPTEYMKLINRYLSQARELQKFAGAERIIRIETCESAQTGELLRILGYRMRGGCGTDLVLETVNAARAFLTIDSGFPLAELEQDLRTSRPFQYDYKPAQVPVLYGAEYWTAAKDRQEGEFIDTFLGDPSLCRLYLGMSKLDPDTADALHESVTVQKLRPFAHVLDFFGGMFELRGGKAVTPGGAKSAQVWAELVGVSPDQGPAFFERIITKDDGWLASYFDALARISGPVAEYLTEPARMKRFYLALRGRITSPGPARPVFRSNTDLMLLTTRLRIEPNGQPHVPGGVEVWKSLFANRAHGKYDSKLAKSAPGWKGADDVLEALFALCRKSVDNEALKAFMAISDVNRRRAKPLEPATVERMAADYRAFSAQYPIFSECPGVSDATILKYLDTALSVNKIGDTMLRADASGLVQGLVGVWQILYRQGAIGDGAADQALSTVLGGFETIKNNRDLFDAGRAGIQALLKAAGANGGSPQEQMLNLLAGDTGNSDPDTHGQVLQSMIRIFEAQRLITLDTLFSLSDNLESLSRGQKPDQNLLNRLASRIAEIQLPRTNLTGVEKNAFTYGYWTERHIDAQRKVNLRAVIDKAAGDAEKLKDARGLLTPFLRDTIVGFNYIAYAPPGAQILLTNPLFVRSHDFIGIVGAHQTWRQTEVISGGWPTSAGGRITGSLAGLPYALAEAEQNFMVPAREQALIWGDLVPQVILSATIPRWWNVTPQQMHWVGLHMRYAQTLVAEAALDPSLRQMLAAVLEKQAVPVRRKAVMAAIESGEVRSALEQITPGELFVLATEAAAKADTKHDAFVSEIKRLEREYPDSVNYQAISRAFGTPKPTLTNSYRPELLYLRTFPTLMGYSSRIMAESWECNLLYWAALADSVHVPPTQLNVLIPEWTRQTIEKIFATHLEDWPAVLRSLRNVGDEVQTKIRIQIDADQKASLQ